MDCVGCIIPAYRTCGFIMAVYAKTKEDVQYYYSVIDEGRVERFEELSIDKQKISRFKEGISVEIGDYPVAVFCYKNKERTLIYADINYKLKDKMQELIKDKDIPSEARWKMLLYIGPENVSYFLRRDIFNAHYEYLLKLDKDFAQRWAEENRKKVEDASHYPYPRVVKKAIKENRILDRGEMDQTKINEVISAIKEAYECAVKTVMDSKTVLFVMPDDFFLRNKKKENTSSYQCCYLNQELGSYSRFSKMKEMSNVGLAFIPRIEEALDYLEYAMENNISIISMKKEPGVEGVEFLIPGNNNLRAISYVATGMIAALNEVESRKTARP